MGHDQPPLVGSVLHRSHSNLDHLLYMWLTRSHGSRLCAHRPVLSSPRRATTSSGNISKSLLVNPKSAVSSTLVDARTKPHPACANTDMNDLSATAITQRPCVLARTPINKHKPDTPLQLKDFAMLLHNNPDCTFYSSKQKLYCRY